MSSSIGQPQPIRDASSFRLKDKQDRVSRMSAQDVIAGTAAEDGADSRHQRVLQIPPPIRIGGSLTKSQYQYTMQTPDTEELYALAPKLKPRCAVPGFRTSPATCRSTTRSLLSTSIATRRMRLVCRPTRLRTLLYSAYGTRQISTIYTPNNEYYVITELLPQYQNDPDGALACCTCTPVAEN